MNYFNNKASAFYSGATRYGGSSAFAKRREAARKSFFSVRETHLPSTSTANNTNIATINKSNMMFNNTSINKPINLVHSYTINSDNIIRKEHNVPQLTSSAKRILSWIEQNSTQSTDDVLNLTKRQRVKHRFNPMPYRAQMVNRPPPPPAQQPILKGQLQMPMPIPFISAPVPAPMPLPTPTPLIEPTVPTVSSDKFKSPKFNGPLKEVTSKKCNTKMFNQPRDMKPKPQLSPPKQKLELSTQPSQKRPNFSAIPRLVEAPKVPPVKETMPIKASIVEEKVPAKTAMPSKLPEPLTNMSQPLGRVQEPEPVPAPIKIQPPAPIKPPQSLHNSAPVPTPITFKFAPAPTQQAVSVQPAPKKIELAPEKPSIPSPVPVHISKLIQQVQVPIIINNKFKTPKFMGPLQEIVYKKCNNKKFSEPRNLKPEPQLNFKPKIDLPALPNQEKPLFCLASPSSEPFKFTLPVKESTPIKQLTPIKEQIQKESTIIKEPTPVKVPEAEHVTSKALNIPEVTLPQPAVSLSGPTQAAASLAHVDMEMDIDPTPSIPAPTPSIPAPTLSWSANTATSTPNATPVLRLDLPIVTNFSAAPVASPISSPLVTPVLTPIASPAETTPSTNPFQPTPRGGPARRILRAGRRLHR